MAAVMTAEAVGEGANSRFIASGPPFNVVVPQESWYMSKPDDLGRSVVQHPPLAKGEHTNVTLPKSTHVDPATRPRVMHPTHVNNKPDFALDVSDIWGAQPRKPGKFRGTNPLEPRYTLPSGSGPQMSSGSAAATPRNDRDQQLGDQQQGAGAGGYSDQQQQQQWRPSYYADTDAALGKDRPKKSPPTLQNFSHDISDIEGTAPGWKPPFRAHVGKNLRDPGLQVADINSYMLKRKPATYTEHVVPPPPLETARPAPEQLPPYQPPPPPPPAPEPVTQLDPDVPPSAYAAGADVLGCSLVHVQRREMEAMNQALAAGKRSKDAKLQHQIAVDVAATRALNKREADDLLGALPISRPQVDELWAACRRMDREGCGKLDPVELRRALDQARLQVGPEQMQTLVHGLRDNVGLLNYRDLSKRLLARTYQQTLQQTHQHQHQRPATAVPSSRPPVPTTAAQGASPYAAAARPISAPAHRRPGSASQHRLSSGGGGVGASGSGQATPRVSIQGAGAAAGAGAGQALVRVPSTANMGSSNGHATPRGPSGAEPLLHRSSSNGRATQPPLAASTSAAYQQQPAVAAGSSSSSPQHVRAATAARAPPYATSAAAAHPAQTALAAAAAVAAANAAATASAAYQQQPQPQAAAPQRPGSANSREKGGKFYPFKARAYWFGGRADDPSVRQDSAAWKATQDTSYTGCKAHGAFLGDGGQIDPNMMPPVPEDAPPASPTVPEPPVVESRPTIAWSLKSGALSPEQLGHQLALKNMRPASAAAGGGGGGRPPSASRLASPRGGSSSQMRGGVLLGGGSGPDAMQPASRSGNSVGSTLKPARPVSAYARLSHDPTSFTNVAHSRSSGLGVQRLERMIAREEVAAVRALY